MKKKTVKMMLTVVPLFFLSVLGIVLLNPVPVYASMPTIYVDPPTSYAEPGESFNVTWSVQDAVDVYAWSVNMSFDPNILEFQNIVEGDFLKGQPEGTSGVLGNAFEGYIWFCVTTRGNYLGVNGSGTLAIAEFKAREGVTGGTVLNISDPGVWDPVLGYHQGGTQLLDHSEPPHEIPRITVDGFFISTQLLPFYDLFLALNSSYYSLLADYSNLLDDYNALLADYDDLLDSYSALETDYSSLSSTHNVLLAIYSQLQSNYDGLQADYDSLSTDLSKLQGLYNSLLANYTNLQEAHNNLAGDLGATRNLNYIFIITTIIFVATTAYLTIRKPKVTTD